MQAKPIRTYKGGTLFESLLQYKRDRMLVDRKFRNDELKARKRRLEEKKKREAAKAAARAAREAEKAAKAAKKPNTKKV